MDFYALDNLILEWQHIGGKSTLQNAISSITGIPHQYLTDGDITNSSIAQRMSWASRRETTREEDIAYCLLGIFDINMPLLYGEGSKAFLRLQEEIMRGSPDQSLLAWGVHASGTGRQVLNPQANQPVNFQTFAPNIGSVFATQPSHFRHSVSIRPLRTHQTEKYEATNLGVRIATSILQPDERILASASNLRSIIRKRARYGTLEYYDQGVLNKFAIPLFEASDSDVSCGCYRPEHFLLMSVN